MGVAEMVMGLRRRLALSAILMAGVFLAAVPTAFATGLWSAPQQLDATGAGAVGSSLIACPSSALCVGAGSSDDGPVTYQTSSAFAFSLTPTFGKADNGTSLTSLQCPSTSLCVGVGDYDDDNSDDYDIVTSTEPAAGPDAWIPLGLSQFFPAQVSCPTVSFCAGADGIGVLVSQDPSGGAAAWHTIAVGNGLVEVTCASADFCAGFDTNGNVWTSTDPAGGPGDWVQSGAAAPLAADVDAGQGDGGGPDDSPFPTDLACTGPSLCVATSGTSDDVLVSTDPAGSSAWTSLKEDTVPITTVSCEPGSTLCLFGDAYGTIGASDDGAGATWTNYSTPDAGGHAIDDISCVAQTCAVASADNLPPAVITLPSATSSGTVGVIKVIHHNPLSSISCPSAKECIGSDTSRYYITANPARGVGSWFHKVETNLPGDRGAGTLDTSCYARTGCLAVTDNAANGLTSTTGGGLYRFNPAVGPHDFSDTHLGKQDPSSFADHDQGFRFVTCAQGSCVAGYPGAWIETANPADNTGWQPVAKPHFDVTCLTGNTSCVALANGPFPGTAGHDLLVAPRRTGPWSAQDIDPNGYIDGLACTSAKACVVVDEGGQLLVSSHPTAGPAAWSVADTDLSGFNGVACESARTCVAVDDAGAVVVGRP